MRSTQGSAPHARPRVCPTTHLAALTCPLNLWTARPSLHVHRHASDQCSVRPCGATVQEQASQVPEVGWMWATTKHPSAQTTVANLRRDGISAKKSLGQNFLTDDATLRQIVASANVQPGDLVLEVGPGTGNLTKHLLAAGAHVTALEKDDTLYLRLQEQWPPARHKLSVLHADVLKVDYAQVVTDMRSMAAAGQVSSGAALESAVSESLGQQQGAQQAAVGVKVVANLPYNITTDFLKQVLRLGPDISTVSVMLQDEAAIRLVRSKAGGADYRAMSIRAEYFAAAKYKFLIPREKYYPVPGVNGALVTFTLRAPAARLAVPSESGFLSVVEQGFGQRRKMLRNSLQPTFTAQQVEAGLAALGLVGTERAQDLSCAQWASLYTSLFMAQQQQEQREQDQQQAQPQAKQEQAIAL